MFRKPNAFTLIEVIVAMTIFSFVMLSVFQIYSSIVTLSKRLDLTRRLQENARNIVESIAQDVRTGGIAFECYTAWLVPPIGCGGYIDPEYSGDGTKILILRDGLQYIKYYLMTESATIGLVECTEIDALVLGKCFLGKESTDTSGNIVKTRVSNSAAHISELRFFISGVDARTFRANTDTEGKVALSFTLSVAPRQWLPMNAAQELKIPIQTTITEKLYKTK